MTIGSAPTDDGAQTMVGDASGFLARVDAHMLELLDAGLGLVGDAARRPIAAGGKRLRPLLVHAARPMELADGVTPEGFAAAAVRAGAAIELVHTASLVHDDLLDAADLRRGEPTIGAVDGRAIAVSAGDLLFSRAFATLAETRSDVGEARAFAATRVLALTARQLAEGEALQARQGRDPRISISDYLLRCRQKTGALFAAALQCGAVLGGGSERDIAALGRFGDLAGMAFQVADGILDCGRPADAAVLGKEPGADVRDGTITLPMLAALARDPGLAAVLAAPVAEADVAVVLDRIRASGALDVAQTTALELRDDALATIEPLAGRFDLAPLHAIAARSVDRIS
jgi:geranylgeranyl pyrophosphate synthase